MTTDELKYPRLPVDIYLKGRKEGASAERERCLKIVDKYFKAYCYFEIGSKEWLKWAEDKWNKMRAEIEKVI